MPDFVEENDSGIEDEKLERLDYDPETLNKYVFRLKKERHIPIKQIAKSWGISDRKLRYLRKGYYIKNGEKVIARDYRIFAKAVATFHRQNPIYYIIYLERKVSDDGEYIYAHKKEMRGFNNAQAEFEAIKSNLTSWGMWITGSVELFPLEAASILKDWRNEENIWNYRQVDNWIFYLTQKGLSQT